MTDNTLINVGIGLMALSIIVLVAFWQGSHEKRSISSTPSIAVENDGVLTLATSMIIHASVDKVFATLLNYKDYSWSSTAKYEWNGALNGGIPIQGSTGTMTLNIEEWPSTVIALKMDHLDQEAKTIVECTTKYPRWLLGTRRIIRVLPVEGHKALCEFKIWSTYDGIAAWYLYFTAKEDLASTQRRFAEELKSFVEGR